MGKKRFCSDHSASNQYNHELRIDQSWNINLGTQINVVEFNNNSMINYIIIMADLYYFELASHSQHDCHDFCSHCEWTYALSSSIFSNPKRIHSIASKYTNLDSKHVFQEDHSERVTEGKDIT